MTKEGTRSPTGTLRRGHSPRTGSPIDYECITVSYNSFYERKPREDFVSFTDLIFAQNPWAAGPLGFTGSNLLPPSRTGMIPDKPLGLSCPRQLPSPCPQPPLFSPFLSSPILSMSTKT